jgi:hypothetical protein
MLTDHDFHRDSFLERPQSKSSLDFLAGTLRFGETLRLIRDEGDIVSDENEGMQSNKPIGSLLIRVTRTNFKGSDEPKVETVIVLKDHMKKR